MTAKQYLMRARRLQARIDQLEQAALDAWDRATGTTQQPGATGHGKGDVGRKSEGYSLLSGTLQGERDRLDRIKADTVATIGHVQDNTLAALLMGYYVNGQTWEQVSCEIHYSFVHTVHRLHPAALAAVEEILEGGGEDGTPKPSRPV